MIRLEEDIKIQLRQSLESVGCNISENEYSKLRQRVSTAGRTCMFEIVEKFGKPKWKKVLGSMNRKYPEEDTIRILGFGYVLTEFLINSFSLENEQKEKVLKLGALANFIVSFFDHFFDSPNNNSVLLNKKELYAVSANHSSIYLWMKKLFAKPEKKMMLDIVGQYFHKLDALVKINERKEVAWSIKKIIHSMYTAELKSANHKEKNIWLIKRKAALPFVIMGLPVFLVVPDNNSFSYLSFVKWLYQVGEFFGSLDDAVDIDVDIREHQLNRFSTFKLYSNYEIVQDVLNALKKLIENNPFYKRKDTDDVEKYFWCCIKSWIK